MNPIAQSRNAATGLGMIIGWVIALAGTMLLASAALKSRQYALIPVAPYGRWSIRGFEPVLAGWETFLGLWLISGALPSTARRVTIGCFSIFACYTLYESLAGKTNCGCFGQVHVNPWFTFILDVAIVLLLVFFAKPPAKLSPWSRRKWPVAVAAAIGLAVGFAAAMVHPKVVSAANGLATADSGGLVILEPHHWVGHRLPVLAHIVSVSFRPGGLWD
jgi:hypothetical protein